MYLNFYNFKKEPFHITPDPEFLYLSPSHKEAMAAIIYGIEQKKGFVTIIGAVGVGKTTILRSYLDSADKQHLKVIYVFNARLTFDGLLKTIFQELEITTETRDTMEMVNALYEVLIEEYKKGNTLVLVIDEAQNMPIETLEDIRMLSNLETTKDKLIQIVLIGQPEFEDNLNLDRLRQLKQRIAIRSTILPLTIDESLDYIRHRILRASGHKRSVFTDQALREIAQRARGIPRVINILCDNALITGFGYQEKPVSLKVVKEVVSDLEGKKKRRFSNRQIAFSLSSIILVFSGVAAFFFLGVPSISFPGRELFQKSFISIRPEDPVEPKVHSKAKPEKPTAVKEEPKHAQSGAEKDVPVKTPPVAEKPVENLNRDLVEKVEPTPVKRPPPPRQRDTVRAARAKQGSPGTNEAMRSDDPLNALIQGEKTKVVDPNLVASGSSIILSKPSGE